MLHEIFLSLSGHPSPLLTADHTSPTSIFSPSEKALLSSIAHLSALHRKLLTNTATISSSHPSSICQAVATAVSSQHLAKFQRKVLEVEANILKKDAGIVGAYSIVPLTAVVGEFAVWTRRMEWFAKVEDFMLRPERKCSGAMIIDELCGALQTGYTDIEDAASSLVKVSETAWLKQVSSWILYGRLPGFGREDFFVQEIEGPEYVSKKELLPAFVTPTTAASLLFIGRSLNHIRVKGSTGAPLEMSLISNYLKELSKLTFPLNKANFSRVIASIRLSLSQTTLQKLLPLSKVTEILSLLREFFLLGRGEFAIALIQEADEKIRSRWWRSDNVGNEKQVGFSNIVVKDGEVNSVLARTWAVMLSLQSSQQDTEEDELLDLARDLVHLSITKQTHTPASKTSTLITSTPFNNLLLSVPVSLSLSIPSPLDLFLSPQDVKIYTSINAYLLSIHRAHLRLTDMWKITSLRREHPAPPGPPFGSSSIGRAKVRLLRERSKERAEAMRSVWATSSAAVFFLAETQAYLQREVVQGSWDGFKRWMTGEEKPTTSTTRITNSNVNANINNHEDDDNEDDIWLQEAAADKSTSEASKTSKPTHDPQTLSTAHNIYLAHLIRSLLLDHAAFTQPLYSLLQSIDHLVALIHRVHTIWTSLDLEADEGVVDAFSDFAKEEIDVRSQMREVAATVKEGIWSVVKVLRDLDAGGANNDFDDPAIGEDDGNEWEAEDQARYVPRKVGRVDRLLMKLDFGGWFAEFEMKAAGHHDVELDSDDDDQ